MRYTGAIQDYVTVNQYKKNYDIELFPNKDELVKALLVSQETLVVQQPLTFILK